MYVAKVEMERASGPGNGMGVGAMLWGQGGGGLVPWTEDGVEG
jgi:hypothetical protein